MVLNGRKKLDTFCKKHSDARQWISNWVSDVMNATWKNSHDIKLRYSTASFLSQNVVIFNVKGNTYRMETSVVYATNLTTGIVFIKWLGSHAEYSKR